MLAEIRKRRRLVAAGATLLALILPGAPLARAASELTLRGGSGRALGCHKDVSRAPVPAAKPHCHRAAAAAASATPAAVGADAEPSPAAAGDTIPPAAPAQGVVSQRGANDPERSAKRQDARGCCCDEREVRIANRTCGCGHRGASVALHTDPGLLRVALVLELPLSSRFDRRVLSHADGRGSSVPDHPPEAVPA